MSTPPAMHVCGGGDRSPYGVSRGQKACPDAECDDITFVLDGLRRHAKESECTALAVLQEGLDTRIMAVCEEPTRILRYVDGINYEARLDCLALDGREFEMLVRDSSGNDAKHILRRGAMIIGDIPAMSGDTLPPEPIDITRNELDYNMERYGFSLMLIEEMKKTRTIRPEYSIAGAMFSRDPRRIFAGIPVMLCNGGINYGLLTYLARRYLFEETLLGIIKTLQDAGRLADTVDRQIKRMESRGVEPYIRAKASILDALRVYEC